MSGFFSAASRVLAGLVGLAGVAVVAPAQRQTLDFNPDWRFTKSDPAGAFSNVLDDSAWAPVTTPHTFNDTDTFDNWSPPAHRGETEQWSGRTWYRKTFRTAAAWRGKRVFLEFEGARQVAEVYCNGRLLGTAKSGFTPFGFDLTPWLRAVGDANVLAVMVDNRFMQDPPVRENDATRAVPLKDRLEQIEAGIPDTIEALQASQIPWNNPHWHPAHGGLYRNVRLHVTDPLHIALPLYSFLQTEGPYAYATQLSPESAEIGIDVPVRNLRKTAARLEVAVQVFDAANEPVLTATAPLALDAGQQQKLTLGGTLTRPRFWQPDYPHIYRVVLELRAEGKVIDTCAVPLGLRAARWDAAHGLVLNGRALKLHGWGQKPTNEWPGLGAALPDWMHRHTLELMREAGGNFVRWGHCAAGPSLIAAGDQLGLVTIQPGVDGEKEPPGGAWLLRAEAFRDTVIYFRNHPSILVWEGGNQKLSREHAAELRGIMDRYDPHGGRAYAHRRADAVTAEFMHLGIGTEGAREITALPVVEGEYNREESPRRVWDAASPPNFGYTEAQGQTYQLTSEQFALNQVAQYVQKLGAPDHAGGANWIFSDTTSGGRVWVEVARASGEVDAVRLPKEAYYVCAAMFRREPAVHIIGHWTYPAGTKKNVYVVANGEEVELFVNDRSLGRQKPVEQFLYVFPDVAWEPGEIKAVAISRHQRSVSQTKRTAGPPAALRLTAITGPGGWRADGMDVALVDVEAVDADGQRCPTFQKRVDFTFVGAGVWRGGYNSGRINSTNVRNLELEAGINRVAIRSTRAAGEIVLRATCPGLQAGGVTILAQPTRIENGIELAPRAAFQVELPSTRPMWSEFDAQSAAPPATNHRAAEPASEAPVPMPSVPTPAPATPAATAPPTAEPSSPAAPETVANPGKSPAPKLSGRFIRHASYSGPQSAQARLQTHARDGQDAYSDAPSPFAALPVVLNGADWLQLPNADAGFHAVDLVELAVSAGSTVFVAHDSRAPRPPWLLTQFRETSVTVHVGDRKLTIFSKRCDTDTSLTLGANTEVQPAPAANQYVVLVNRTE